jgi:dTDP-4-dehydrorhamnose reductase
MIKKKILIIGSRGHLGSYLAKKLPRLKKYKIIQGHKKKISLIKIKYLENKIKKLKLTAIINCSAFTDVDLSEKKKKLTRKLNFYCIKKLCEICLKNKIKLIHFSSDYVYGGKNKFYKETDNCAQLNHYGKTKFLGDNIITYSNIKFLIFRVSFLLSGHKKNFIFKIKEKLKKNMKIKIISNSYTSPTTIKFISDFFIQNFYKIISNQINGIFNLRNKQVVSYYQVSKEIQKNLNKKNLITKCNYNEFPSIAKRPLHSKLDITKVKKYFKIPNNNWKKEIKSFL